MDSHLSEATRRARLSLVTTTMPPPRRTQDKLFIEGKQSITTEKGKTLEADLIFLVRG
jgi:hypothetical protein